jgi:hypothetical protein
MIAQNLSTDTATRENIDVVHSSIRKEFMKRQPWKLYGKPTLVAIAEGIPTNPTNRSATAKEST